MDEIVAGEKRDGQIRDWEPGEIGMRAARTLLGRRLKFQRKRHGLTVREAAEVAGVSKATYERFEAGTAMVPFKPLYFLAGRYEMTGGELANETMLNAPRDPVKRLEWVRTRNRNIAAGVKSLADA